MNNKIICLGLILLLSVCIAGENDNDAVRPGIRDMFLEGRERITNGSAREDRVGILGSPDELAVHPDELAVHPNDPAVHVEPAGSGIEQEFVPGEILVKFKLGIQPASVKDDALMERLFRDSGGPISQAARDEFGLDRIYRVELPEGADVLDAVKEYAAIPGVEYAEPNYIDSVHAVPNDAMYGEQWAHQNMQSEMAWEIETGSS
ncbi:MAG: hypothetical protein KKB24_05325, partial [Candidatus Altiarchaeota archaeon]|nr:hypothetical protein [Candidatus Altiarchaeota archaeon]